MELSAKQKMLGAALFARQCARQTIVAVMMALDTDDQIDDMTWYMGEHPNAGDDELISVAYQLAKESSDNNKGE